MRGDLHDLLGPYLLDALGPEERAEFEDHLDECDQCRTEVDRLAPVVVALAPEAVEPPPHVRDAVLRRAEETPQEPARASGHPRRTRRAGWLVAAAAVVVIAGGIAIGLRPGSELEHPSARHVLAAGDVRTHDMHTTMGMVRIGMSHRMHMVAVDGSKLGDPGRGMAYEVWWSTPHGARSAGMIDDATAIAFPMGEGDLEITREPAAGSAQPTSAPLLRMPATDL